MWDLPKSLYVHIPFCARKCHYCAFNSFAGSSSEAQTEYTTALIQEIEGLGNAAKTPLDLETIYVGGGTPTALSPEDLGRVLDAVRGRLPEGSHPEWTVEMNPGTATPECLEVLLRANITRISMGVQTLDPKRLKAMGRIHTPDDVGKTVEALKARGFTAINLDLIYGQPEQTQEQWLADVEGILAMEPDHISLYALQYEEGTVYTAAKDRGRFKELDDHRVVAMFHAAKDRLQAEGLELYEISNFAYPGRESRHNTNYWQNQAYYGVGAGAYACVEGERRLNEGDPATYVRQLRTHGHAICERELLTPEHTYVECLSSGLRTREGVDCDHIAQRTGFDPRQHHAEQIERITSTGLAELKGSTLRLSTDGLWVLDSIMEGFLL